MHLERLLDELPTTDPLSSEQTMIRGLVDSLTMTQESMSALKAREAMLLACLLEVVELQTARLPSGASRDRELPLRNAAAEVGAALRVSDRTVQRKLADASTLLDRFPATYVALSEGRITSAHVSIILQAGADIRDDAARAQFEQHALDRANIETPGRLRSIIGAIAERAQPTSINDRHRAARSDRAVWVRDLPDGMAELLAVLPAVLAHGIHDRLTQMAHTIRRPRPDNVSSAPRTQVASASRGEAPHGQVCGTDADTADSRTINELRADILSDLALGASPIAAGDGLDMVRAHVQVTVPVLTLAGHSDRGAALAGVGPIDADTARRLAGNASGWDRVMTHPVTGAILAVDRYRPNEDLRRTLRVRDEHCRFPGCRQPVWRTDLDHSHDAATGGETRDDNLAHLCRRHHVLKHAHPWSIRHLGGGTLEWTSPTGRTYIDVPTPTLRFVPDGDPPPF